MHVPLAGQAAFAEIEPVVGGKDHDGVPIDSLASDFIKQSPDDAIDAADQTIIALQRKLSLLQGREAPLPPNSRFRLPEKRRKFLEIDGVGHPRSPKGHVLIEAGE